MQSKSVSKKTLGCGCVPDFLRLQTVEKNINLFYQHLLTVDKTFLN